MDLSLHKPGPTRKRGETKLKIKRNIRIETHALKMLLLGILSCKCPVTLETEKRLFAHYFEHCDSPVQDYEPVLAICDENGQKTPFHNLFEFCASNRDDPGHFTIAANDVLRFLGSFFHYNMVLSNHPDIMVENPELLASHILVPVSLVQKGETICGIYQNSRILLEFTPVIQVDTEPKDQDFYALHMGLVLGRIDTEQAAMLKEHQLFLNGFSDAVLPLKQIHLTRLAPYGDHAALTRERVQRYFTV